MRNVPSVCITETNQSVIKFEEKKSVVKFNNPKRLTYKMVAVDGCALTEGVKCDNLLCSADEQEERYVELKGQNIKHAIEQLATTIVKLGEFSFRRYAYVSCTKVAPQIRTDIQAALLRFKKDFNATLLVKTSPIEVNL
ncbi:MAG: hypothetical protein IKW46_11365 [Bacteroidaceae bacterium]|nr:hypothetical protein [Bacteroidaceae bacterium]